jgi:hypothetical protein
MGKVEPMTERLGLYVTAPKGKSHRIAKASQHDIGTTCGLAYSTYDQGVIVTDKPSEWGVCGTCERRAK